MDRGLVYPGQVPLETDVLFVNKSAMVGLAKLAAVAIGTGTIANGCAASPGTGLTVSIAAGEIYQLANIDDTIYGSIALDTTHQIVKQGIALDATVLSTPAPGTAGQSINHLIQARFLEVDGSNVTLPYYNSANPTVPFAGPAGAGTSQPTRRNGTLELTVKSGAAAATGSQVTPTPDAGKIGLYVVTIANGALSVTSGNIAVYDSTKFIGADLLTQIRTVNRAARLFLNQL